VHTLNGSGLALPRLIAALAEQYQTASTDGYPEYLESKVRSLIGG
jgi:seryl-tRNA synthetase